MGINTHMKIAFISDTHLGFNWRDKELREDSVRQAREAFMKAISEKVDLIIHPGDIFDDKIPKPEVWVEALKIFSMTQMAPESGVRPVSGSVNPLPFRGIPVIAIHGNHDRRGGTLKNPVEALDAAGHLVYLNSSSVLVEKNGEKLNIFGMGYVPESYVLKTLRTIAPKRIDGAYNIFVMHQNVKEYLPDDVSFLSLGDLPNFDLVVNGHIHNNTFEDKGRFKFMMPGSTVATQLKKEEAGKKKGFYIFDTDTEKAKFVEIESTRPFVYLEMKFSGTELSNVYTKVRKKIEDVLENKFSMKPIIKLKLVGSLSAKTNIDRDEISKGFDDAIIIVDNRLETENFMKRIEELREMHASRVGVENLGLALLRKKLTEVGYSGPSVDEVFDQLIEGDVESLIPKFIQHYQQTQSRDTSSL